MPTIVPDGSPPTDGQTSPSNPDISRLLGDLLDGSHLALPDRLNEVVATAAERVGWTAVIYLVDYDGDRLRPMLGPDAVADADAASESVDGTLAGRAFRTVEPVLSSAPDGHLWVPLVDGVERLGVIRLTLPPASQLDPQTTEHVRWFAHLVAHLIAGKSEYADAFHLLRVDQPRTPASELIWSMLPPLMVACHGLVIAGSLAPTHSVAGDAFDYAIDGDVAHIAITDATGHDIGSAVIGALVLAAYRTGRRQGLDLVRAAEHMDATLNVYQAHAYATAVLCQLDLTTGMLSYVAAGHPAPLLLRNSRVVKSLEGGRRPLLGLAGHATPHADERLEPGDWVVFYTDGITEARDHDGQFFGLERLIDVLERCAADQQPAAETLRRITQSVMAHQHGVLQDDATIVVLQWRTELEQRLTAAR